FFFFFFGLFAVKLGVVAAIFLTGRPKKYFGGIRNLAGSVVADDHLEMGAATVLEYQRMASADGVKAQKLTKSRVEPHYWLNRGRFSSSSPVKFRPKAAIFPV
ncbi:unnamed protein product, partial [Linum tenue]